MIHEESVPMKFEHEELLFVLTDLWALLIALKRERSLYRYPLPIVYPLSPPSVPAF